MGRSEKRRYGPIGGEHRIREKSYAKDFQVGLLSSLAVGKQMFVDLRDSGSAVNVLSPT